ncbi:MAG: DegT/DnrJ/EryC1/StrS family aminotransferase [Methanobacteriota archaeon]
MIQLAQPQIGREECDEVSRVLRSGRLVQGTRVLRFERSIARFIRARWVAAVSSGTSALYVALGAMGIGPGDAVFVPAFTFPATFSVIELRGARPVLVDVDPTTYCMTAVGLRRAVEEFNGRERRRAVLPVHEFGCPCEMSDLVRVAGDMQLHIIEDAACAIGTTFRGRHVGTFGAFGCFSWHPRKGITTGEGGAIVSADSNLHARVAALRNHGLEEGDAGTSDLSAPSLNFRMTEFQAALGSIQLRRLPRWLQIRRALARLYLSRLRDLEDLRLPADVQGHSWQTFMAILPHGIPRIAVRKKLRAKGIEASFGAHAIHMLSYCRKRYGYRPSDFPVSAELYERGLAIPLLQGLSREDVLAVCSALTKSLHA